MTADKNLDPAALDEKVAGLSYEEARAKLVEIVSRLEQGNIPLEEALTLWELGEALARRCESWLSGARERLAAAQERTRAAAKAGTEGSDTAGSDTATSGPTPTGGEAPSNSERVDSR